MKKKIKRIVTCILGTALLFGSSVSYAKEMADADQATAEFQRFFHALNLIRKHYVDPDKVTYKNLFRLALQGLLKELDPYCVYETAETFKQTKSDFRSQRVGIGVFVVMQSGKLEVRAMDPGSPAEKAGLKQGDFILEIDGTPVDTQKMEENIKKLQGTVGENVMLKIYRRATDKHLDLIVTREVLHIHTITGTKILDKVAGTGYLRITQFNNATASDLDKALADLKRQGLQQLIIDLRDNPGGLVLAAAQVSSRFLPPGKIIVTLEGRNNKELKRFTSKKCQEDWRDLPVVLLVNGSTASAAEILTACLQDYKRAVVIGEQTFGKGVVQNLLPFGKDEALRITTAHYCTPSKKTIQDKGVTPDIVIALTPARRFALANQLNFHPGVILPLTKNAVRDIQLERALEVLKAVKLFRDTHQK